MFEKMFQVLNMCSVLGKSIVLGKIHFHVQKFMRKERNIKIVFFMNFGVSKVRYSTEA